MLQYDLKNKQQKQTQTNKQLQQQKLQLPND